MQCHNTKVAVSWQKSPDGLFVKWASFPSDGTGPSKLSPGFQSNNQVMVTLCAPFDPLKYSQAYVY